MTDVALSRRDRDKDYPHYAHNEPSAARDKDRDRAPRTPYDTRHSDWHPQQLIPSTRTVLAVVPVVIIPVVLLWWSSVYAAVPAIVHGNPLGIRQNDGSRLSDNGAAVGVKGGDVLGHLPFKKSMGDPFSRFYRYVFDVGQLVHNDA